MTRKTRRFDLTRREWIAGTGLASFAAIMGAGAAASRSASAAAASVDAERSVTVARKGVYPTVPLRSESINVTAIQSRVYAVNVRNLKRTMNANRDHVIELIDMAQGSAAAWGGE